MLQAEVLVPTFQVRAGKVAIVFTDKAADLIGSEFLEALSTTHQLHHLFASSGVFPDHHKHLLMLHKFYVFSVAEAGENHGKIMVQLVHASHLCFGGDGAGQLSQRLGSEKDKVIQDYTDNVSSSETMGASRKEALAGCGVVFEMAAGTVESS